MRRKERKKKKERRDDKQGDETRFGDPSSPRDRSTDERKKE